MTRLPRYALLFFAFILALFSCRDKKTEVDSIFFNGIVHTLDSVESIYSAIAVSDGKVVAVGDSSEIFTNFKANELMDFAGTNIYPGFIDAHCHFYHYGLGLNELNLKSCSSFEELIEMVIPFADENPDGWIVGRGWDHTKWPDKKFPDNKKLDSLFPDRPLLLKRIDGHAALVNSAALELAGLNANSTIPGGELLTDKDGLTGLLIDNAVDKVFALVPPPTRKQQVNALLKAQKNCFEVGLTSVVIAGLEYDIALLIDSLHKTGDLKMRVYAMLNPTPRNYTWALENGQYTTDRIGIRSFKLYADGSLGSRGALLKEPYCDKPGHFGLPVNHPSTLDSQINTIQNLGYQVNTHCIGDSANHLILSLYGKYLQGSNDKRWRIEHAQVIDPNDFVLFSRYNIIPSVQPTHATSDMRWAVDRLCSYRMEGAYSYNTLLSTNGVIALGTDFPVEGISPIYTFYAAVVRKDHRGGPKTGFRLVEGLSRSDALKGMTTWAAYSCFEENKKGTIEVGKLADFIQTSHSLEDTPENELLNIQVLQTYSGGQSVQMNSK
jgi:predicted amidohydrolase YtcJ